MDELTNYCVRGKPIVNSGLRPPLALALDQAEDNELWHELLSTRVLSCNTACLQFTQVTLHSLFATVSCNRRQMYNMHTKRLSALMYQEAETPLKLLENFMGWVRGNLDNSKTGRKVLRGAIWKFISVGTCSYQIKSMFINWCSLKAIHLMKFRVKCKVITEYKVLTFVKYKIITSQM